MAATQPVREDVQPVANENLDRFLTGTVTVLPILALGVVAWQVWSSWLGWSDVIVFAIMYISTGLGIYAGYLWSDTVRHGAVTLDWRVTFYSHSSEVGTK